MRPRARDGIFVGREPELAVIEHCLEMGHAGQGAVVVLSGEPGIGKSRMLGAALRAAATRRYCVAAAQNVEHARSPFAPWVDILRTLEPLAPEIRPAGRSDAAIYRQFVEGELFDEPRFDKRRLFVILANALERGASSISLAIGLDDAQWLDPESLEFLAFAAPRLSAARLLVFAAVRTGTSPDDEAILTLRRLPNAVPIVLRPLTASAVREMIVAIAPRRMGRSAVDTIVSQAGGNPLFVAELVRDAMAIEKSLLPPTIALLAKNRLDLLAPGALRIIEACSVVGITFRVADISAITTAAKHEVLAALRAARDIGLLLEHDHPDEFAFTHGLFRSAVYERMLVAERIPMHLSLAKHLESAGERARDLATLAYHWRQAGERRRAADFAIRAGDAAMQIGAYSSARDCYLEALADGIDDSLASAEVEERLARALDRAGDSHTAVRYFKMASEDRAAYGDARGALATLLEFASASHRAGDADAMAKACNIVLSDSDDSALVVRARSLLAMHHVLRNELDAGQAHIDASESIAGPRDARDELTLRWAGAQIAHYRNEDSWSTQAREALQIAERSNDAGLLAYTLMNFGAMSRTSGRDQDAIEAWDRAIDLADNNGLLFASSYARSQKVQALHFRGHLDQAYRLAVENAGLHVDAVMARIYCASSTLDLLADMDRLDDLPMLERSDLLEEAFATGEDGHFASLTAAHVNALVVRNTMDQVPALIRRAIEATTTFAYTSHALVTFARFGGAEDVARAEALRGPLSRSGTQRLHHFTIGAIGALRRGERSESRRLVRTAMDLARQLEAPLYLGLLHELVGERDEAIGLYERVGAAGQIRILSGKRQKQLTSRERQVADLIARGRTNRDIARELALSERTVEHHAAAIYAKLGFETRAAFIAAGSLLHAGTSKSR